MSSPSPIPFHTLRTDPDGQQCDTWPEQTLLQSMEQGSIAWPSSCRNGQCRTCLGVLIAGEVHYQMEWPGLTPEEHASGCVLPCVAHPRSDVVIAAPAL